MPSFTPAVRKPSSQKGSGTAPAAAATPGPDARKKVSIPKAATTPAPDAAAASATPEPGASRRVAGSRQGSIPKLTVTPDPDAAASATLPEPDALRKVTNTKAAVGAGDGEAATTAEPEARRKVTITKAGSNVGDGEAAATPEPDSRRKVTITNADDSVGNGEAAATPEAEAEAEARRKAKLLVQMRGDLAELRQEASHLEKMVMGQHMQMPTDTMPKTASAGTAKDLPSPSRVGRGPMKKSASDARRKPARSSPQRRRRQEDAVPQSDETFEDVTINLKYMGNATGSALMSEVWSPGFSHLPYGAMQTGGLLPGYIEPEPETPPGQQGGRFNLKYLQHSHKFAQLGHIVGIDSRYNTPWAGRSVPTAKSDLGNKLGAYIEPSSRAVAAKMAAELEKHLAEDEIRYVPAQAKLVLFSMHLKNLSYDGLLANHNLHMAFMKNVKKAICLSCGCKLEDVDLNLARTGHMTSVLLNVTITAPNETSAKDIVETLTSSPDLGIHVMAKINLVPKIATASLGTIYLARIAAPQIEARKDPIDSLDDLHTYMNNLSPQGGDENTDIEERRRTLATAMQNDSISVHGGGEKEAGGWRIEKPETPKEQQTLCEQLALLSHQWACESQECGEASAELQCLEKALTNSMYRMAEMSAESSPEDVDEAERRVQALLHSTKDARKKLFNHSTAMEKFHELHEARLQDCRQALKAQRKELVTMTSTLRRTTKDIARLKAEIEEHDIAIAETQEAFGEEVASLKRMKSHHGVNARVARYVMTNVYRQVAFANDELMTKASASTEKTKS